MIIAIDFDGTCVEHEYPEVGPDVPGAAEWLRRFAELGAKLILWTMRDFGRADPTNVPGTYIDPLSLPWIAEGAPEGKRTPLGDAVKWFADRRIPLLGINHNPTQRSWTRSPKCYANVYIDDAAACCPLRENMRVGGRPYVDWSVVGPKVESMILAAQPAPTTSPTPR